MLPLVVAEINATATENPERINTQPYDVWLFKIKADDEATSNLELASLMPNQQYESGLNN
jgi:glycine cleavage system H lipoate-binding protein